MAKPLLWHGSASPRAVLRISPGGSLHGIRGSRLGSLPPPWLFPFPGASRRGADSREATIAGQIPTQLSSLPFLGTALVDFGLAS